ncbi:uncharacterized protein ANIA_10242 [Aspergillus nidulans FGSC A4]|uniref:Uncharacterized protein n=1 Tax=Emericella nidulans (strain FGSC A4 / ATCC 38163 / CBS 112.46 / NRRL 194 / M139) TaxID=227321 RepID=C8VPM3_EMENI|nr:hypothetical protein [Aspergillus nidulans FGSC A4]CBF85611.1 TPA: hypothetical protein ANIA_10242 [Aspergillus nidulans FGSC A4]
MSPLAQSQCVRRKFELRGLFGNCLANPSQKLHSLLWYPGNSLSSSSFPEQQNYGLQWGGGLCLPSLIFSAGSWSPLSTEDGSSRISQDSWSALLPMLLLLPLLLSSPKTASWSLYFAAGTWFGKRKLILQLLSPSNV